MNKSSEELLDALIRTSAMNADRAAKVQRDPCNCGHDKNAYERGLYKGWADGLELASDTARQLLPQIEADAFLVPPVEEDLRERLMREEMAETELRYAWGDR